MGRRSQLNKIQAVTSAIRWEGEYMREVFNNMCTIKNDLEAALAEMEGRHE